MPAKKPSRNANFMKSIQRPIVWAIVILFGIGIIWWTVAQYLGSGFRNNTQDVDQTIKFEETVGGLTRDGTPVIDSRYWITYSEYEISARDTLSNIRSQGYNLDPYFEVENNPSEMGIRYELFRSLIDQKTLLLYAVENDVVPTAQQIKSESDRIVNQYVADENTKAAIIYQYGSVEAFAELVQEYVSTQLLSMNVQAKALPNIEEDFKQYVADNMTDLKYEYEKVTASHILVTDEASALELKAKIEEGVLSFSQAASEFSIDTGSAIDGGNLGEFGHGQMVKEFEDAAFAATPGVITGPVLSQFGYHLIDVATKTTFDTYEEFVKVAGYDTEYSQYSNDRFNSWLSSYKEENKLSYAINDPDLVMYEKYANSRNDAESSQKLMAELQNEYFDGEGNVLIGDSYLPLVIYTELADSRVSELRNEILDLEDLKSILTTVPASITSLSKEEIAAQLETTPSTDSITRVYLSNSQRAHDYFDKYGISELVDVEKLLSEKNEAYDKTNTYFESSVKFLYSTMPNSSQVINYMYRIDGNDPKIVYLYNESIYNRNIRPLLENPTLLDSYLQYYGQYFGAQAVSLLIDSPVQSVESDLNMKILNITDVATDLKVSTLYLLVDMYEKLANIQKNEQMMRMYLIGEMSYLEMLLELYPDDAALKSTIETVQFQISELATGTGTTTEATGTEN
ncbi:MAG TPA: peptidylprolyl isomerase [Mesotoga infera]|jgi:parvulin-like peptidyl-prolyl isomerase|nr:peptidylprolyl isomerase [Mesotoga sp.]NLI06084.1 parvulin peptidyl-prolyl isomerase [Thermotogaceae bacterium]HON28489.1 peptidylprolyl isomerase [Mesotoga infera]HPD36964.1 peptidylprolyl isomerase [Mesotoga infera]HRR43525.1 peptidylprolyl isomerase [Mesotoga sp.]